jgi:hypothetical protein
MNSIGAACARDLLANGASLALTYSTNKANLDRLVEEINPQAAGRTISSHQCDVGKEGDLQRLFDQVKGQHGQHPDILVVNAGYGKRVSNILEIDIEEWDHTINVNLRSSFIITKLAVPHMLEQAWGRVIYISSIAAGGTSINGCHYSASKGTFPWIRVSKQSLTTFNSRRSGFVEEPGQQDGQKRHHVQRCCACHDYRNRDDPDRRATQRYPRRYQEYTCGSQWKHRRVCKCRDHALSHWLYDGSESFAVRRAEVGHPGLDDHSNRLHSPQTVRCLRMNRCWYASATKHEENDSFTYHRNTR